MKYFKALIAFLLITSSLFGHEVRPAYFSVTQMSNTTFQIVWKVPARGTSIPKITPVLPANWKVTDSRFNLLPGNLRRTYTVEVLKGLEGDQLYFEGLEKTLIDVLVSIKRSNGVQYSSMVKPVNPVYIIPVIPNPYTVVKTYLFLGVEHILLGIDHLLFVLALLFITSGFKKLVKTITAFTIAHSITLSLATLGLVGLPSPPVEATIALSIVFLAVELMRHHEGHEGLAVRFPWIVAFTFGLLHGFGFAGALADIGLPQIDIPLALLFFNVGVELGQLAFVLTVMGAFSVLRITHLSGPTWLKKIPPYAIGSIASFWLIQRCVGFIT